MEMCKEMIIIKSCKLPLNAFQVGTSRRNKIINKEDNFYLRLKNITTMENRAKEKTT